MAARTPYALRRRATYAVVVLVGLAALLVIGARGGSLWLDGQAQRVVQLLDQATGGQASIGRWQVTSRGVNPVIRAADLRIAFDGVEALHLGQLDLELDLIESLARSAPIARGLVVRDGVVALTADDVGVRLRGAPQRPADDTLLRLLADTDAVEIHNVNTDIHLAQRDTRCQLRADARLRGVSGRHAGRVQVVSGEALVEVDFDVAGAALAWRTWRGDARVDWKGVAAVGCAGMALAGPLADARVDRADGHAEMHFSRGQVSVVGIVDVAGQAVNHTFSMQAVPVRAAWRGQRLRAAADVSGVEVSDAALFPAGGELQAEMLGGSWRLVAPETSLALLADRLLQTGLLKEVHERWLRSLAPRADLGRTHMVVDAGGWVLRSPFRDLAMQPYKGAPGIDGAYGRVMIKPGAVRMRLDETPAQMVFPAVFAAPAPHYDRIGGTIDMVFQPGWVAIVGHDLEADSAVGEVRGDFALWRPDAREEQVLYLDVGLDHGSPLAINHYIPNGLSSALQNWLRGSVVNARGEITDGKLVYHGHLLDRPGDMRRRAALGARLHDVDFRYHPDWPIATVVDGAMVVDASGVTARAAHFSLEGNAFTDAFGRLPNGSDILRLRGAGVMDANAGIRLLKATPVRESVAFLDDGWEASGPVAVTFDGRVPLEGAQVDPVVNVALDARGMAVRNDTMKLDVTDIRGALRYDYPALFDAPQLTARFLDRPVDVRIETPGPVNIHLEGLTDVRAVERWTGQGIINTAKGELAYTASVSIPLDSDDLRLQIRSNLVGVEVALPEPVGKTAASPRPSEVVLWFPDEPTTMLQYDYGADIRGISEIHDGMIKRAVVALAGAEPRLPEDSRISVRGSMHRASMDEWLTAGEVMAGDDGDAMPPIHLDNLQIDRLHAFDRVFEEIRLDALDLRDEWRFEFANAEFSGRAVVPDVGVIDVDLDYMHVPEGEPGTSSLIYVEFSELPDLDVSIADLRIGGEEYGSWKFDLRATSDVLRLENIVGQARGVQVGTDEARATLVWSKTAGFSGPECARPLAQREQPALQQEQWDAGCPVADIQRTTFNGMIIVGDVEAAQVAWGLDPSLVAEDLTATASLAWPGAPDALTPAALSGSMSLRSGSGRFEQLETGANALRILGIFNFAALSRRARLDFSDVLGKGLSFDTIEAELTFEDGMLRMPKPALVEGTGSTLRVTGEVNLKDWTLDNEVVLTLPVSRSLPWYAAYAALANPLAGAGVLVAERLLRDQLDSFSSARYRVTGTLDDPKLTFVSIFDMTPPAVAGAGESDTES